ncbi:MAG: hypothetical protein M3Q30_03430 [Actinomycetota bacterium]|nr:hypothetical protein [Actinomycetota bacterium]
MNPQSGVLATPHGSAHSGKPALLAHYRTLVDVRHAIARLEASGVDGDDLALVGDAALLLEQTPDRTRTDSRFLSSVTRSIAVGILAGALLGAAFGAVFVGALLLA